MLLLMKNTGKTMEAGRYCLQGHVPDSVRDAIYKSQSQGLQVGRIVRQLGHLWSKMDPEMQKRLYMGIIDAADPEDELVVELMRSVDYAIVSSLLGLLPDSSRLLAQYAESRESEQGKPQRQSHRHRPH